RSSRDPACGPCCRQRPCTLREILAGRDLAASPRLALWIELLTVAHLAGQPRPRPRPGVPLHPADLPSRTVECALARLAGQAVESRHPELAPFFRPEDLAGHVAGVAAGWLAGGHWRCGLATEVGWQAGRYRWADAGRALAGWCGRRDRPHPDTGHWRSRGLDLPAHTVDGQLALLRAHPTRCLPGRSLLFGGVPAGPLESAVNALSDAADPATRLAEATAFLDTGPAEMAGTGDRTDNPTDDGAGAGWPVRLLVPHSAAG
ncbi:MAG TPA: hypothetical protein VFX70_08485, partial [Mycobacteriales bacterium]|nr:hypothetical protein [Mycobacteriales bacterium]